MAKTRRTRTVVRSAKTGRFVKKSAAKYSPKKTVTEKLDVSSHSLKVVRSAKTGRFMKRSSPKRRARVKVENVKR